jgi:uncharacterized protein (DUF2062 family)
MRKKKISDKIKRFAKLIYLKLFRINDSPLKIALGFGLGVFVGVMPAMGPVIAFALAFVFRVNRASALLGSILFNTWVGVISLLLAARIGSAVTGLSYRDVYGGWNELIKSFSWDKLFKTSIHEVLIPIGIGYLFISLFFAIVSTMAVYVIAMGVRNKKQPRG